MELRQLVRSAVYYLTDHILYIPGVLLVLFPLVCLVGLLIRRIRGERVRTLRKNGVAGIFGNVMLGGFSLTCWFSMFLILFYMLGIPATDGVRFVLFLVFYLFLPGYLFARRIPGLSGPSALYAVSAVSGMCVLLLVYIFASLTGRMTLVLYVSPVLSLAALVKLRKDSVDRQRMAGLFRLDFPLLAVVSLFLLYSVGVRSAYAIAPTRSGSASVFMDSLYIVANSAALKRGLFAESLIFPGFQLRYHTVSNILQACSGLVTGISAVNTFLVFWPFLYLTVSICSIHAVLSAFREREEHAAWMTALVLLSENLSFGVLTPFTLDVMLRRLYMGTANLEAYLLILPNGNDIAICGILCAALIGILAYRKKNPMWLSVLLMLLFTFLTTGAKAAYGLCICGALVGSLLLIALQRNGINKLGRPFLLMLAAGIGFAAAYLAFIYNPAQSATSTVTLFSPADPRSSLHFETLYTSLQNHLGRFELSDSALLAIAFPLSVFIILPYVILPFFGFFIERLRRFRAIPPEDMLIGGIALCGLAAYYLINIDGYSQAYFLLAAICFIHIIGQTWLEEHFPRFHFVFKLLTVILLSVSMFSTTANMAMRTRSSLNSYKQTYDNIHYSWVAPEPEYDALSAYEYEGMEWLRNNTPQDALVVCDRFFTSPVDKEARLEEIDRALDFYYPAFSERQMFLSGYSYSPRTKEMANWIEDRLDIIDELYSQETEERGEILKENDISYMVLSQLENSALDLSEDESIACVFKNRDISIYCPVIEEEILDDSEEE